MRATLNGKTGNESSYAGDNLLGNDECVLSCFPSVLANAIKPRTYEVSTK